MNIIKLYKNYKEFKPIKEEIEKTFSNFDKLVLFKYTENEIQIFGTAQENYIKHLTTITYEEIENMKFLYEFIDDLLKKVL